MSEDWNLLMAPARKPGEDFESYVKRIKEYRLLESADRDPERPDDGTPPPPPRP